MAEERWQIHAHRGGRLEFDENTLAAFQASYDHGLRGFETDVRLSRDGALVVIHDNRLERTTWGMGVVEDLTAAELRQVRTRQGHPIPFLEDLVDFFADKPGLYIEFEMKTEPERYPQERLEAYCRTLVDAVTPRLPPSTTAVLTSFDSRPLRFLKSAFPNLELMWITSRPCAVDTIQATLDLGLRRLACTWDGTSRAAVRAAHDAGLVVAGWPGRSVQDYLLGVALGFDHLCADNPVEVMEFKKRHLAWLT